MREFDEFRLSLPDGYAAYARYWSPAEAPRGAVLYHHGIQSHCGWFEASARALVRAGYAVLQVDRRGCGRNEIDRGHAESADQLIADAHAARDELLRRSACAHYHVVGVSWGGKLGVAAYVADPSATASLTLVTPGLFPRVGVSAADMARIGLAMLYEPLSLHDIPLNDAELLTSDVRRQEFIAGDPLTLRQCTAGFYLASRRMDRIVTRLGQSPPVPVHLLLAEDEGIIDNQKTLEFVRSLTWPAKVISQFPGRHSLEFEGDPKVYFDRLVDFLNRSQ